MLRSHSATGEPLARSSTPSAWDGTRARQLVFTMARAAGLGLVLGVVVVSVDRAWLTPPPLELASIESVRALLSAFIGGLITVAVFSLWMRTVVVGLVSDQFSPRLLVTFLEDRFQRVLLASMAGGLAVVTVVLLGLPQAPEAHVPLLGTAVALLIALAALAAVLIAIQHAIGSLSPMELVGKLAEQALTVLERQASSEETQVAPVDDAVSVQSPGAGWVTKVDRRALLRALPAEGTMHVRTRVGEFVTPRSTIARISGARAFEFPPDAITLSRTRHPERDLAFAVGHLIDVAVHALTGGGKDTATAHEALAYLGYVLERIVERRVGPEHARDDRGRRVFDEGAWEPADYIRMCSERVRVAAAREPDAARHLLQMLGKARAAAVSFQDRSTVAEIARQVDALLELVDSHGALARDRQQLERTAEEVLRPEPIR